jgi:serine/threonine-protein kinase
MGMVAAATHLGLDERVAIKLLRPDVIADAETCSRFLREAQAAVKLKSEHVARVTDVGTLPGGSPYMVMEFLEGLDLDQMLAASGPIAPQLAIDFVLQGCEGLAEAHSLGIVHRDLKPSNFFVTWRSDGSALVKVLDFGISKAPIGIDLALTQTQSVLGTPAYMSPEQMRSARRVDARTDLWSIGTVLYELIEGRRPFEAESFSEMCVKVAADPPDPMRQPVPCGLDAVIFKCLEKNPDHRFQSIAELALALRPFARDPNLASMRVDRIRRTMSNARPRLQTPPPVVQPSTDLLAELAATEPTPLHALPTPPPDPAIPGRGRRLAVIAGVALAVIAAGIAIALLARRPPSTLHGTVEAPDANRSTVHGTVDAGVRAPAADAAVAAVEAPVDAAPAVEKVVPKKRRPKKRPRREEKQDDVFGKRK